jgi:hypothetical protein
MNMILAPLNNAPDVIGAAIFDPNDQCVESQLPSPYEAILLMDAVEKLRVGFDSFSTLGDPGDLQSYTSMCENGGLMIRRAEEYTIVSLFKATANIVVVNVAMNVVALMLKRRTRAVATPSTSSGGWTQSGISRVSGHYPAVADAVDIAVLHRLVRLYETHVGPAAKVVIRATLKRLGASPRSLAHDKYSALVDMLASKIPDMKKRRAFVQHAETLK